MSGWLRTLTLVCAIGAGLSAGVFFAFSTFVMKALGDLPSSAGITAMQSINRAAPTPLFMLALFGTAAGCVVLAIAGALHRDEPGAIAVVAGSLVFLVAIVLTAAYHVPHNDALDAVDPNGAGAATTWNAYLTGWTAWNHVRTLASLAGATVLTLALRAGCP